MRQNANTVKAIPAIGKTKAAEIVAMLEAAYPDAQCSLDARDDPWKLLVAARLSAQCTDARVNAVCVPLFEAYPDVSALADADIGAVEAIVKPCGLFHVKARDIINESRIIRDSFGGEVPSDMDALLSLPGVGRKIANLIRGDVFGLPAVVTDTHCIRIARRLGFYGEDVTDPYKIEQILAGAVPSAKQSDFCHRLVLFGREYCSARSPKCGGCPLAALCESEDKTLRATETRI